MENKLNDFNGFLDRVKTNDPTLTKTNVRLYDLKDPNFVSLDNIQELKQFAVAMAKNTLITEIENLYFNNLSKNGMYNPEKQLYIDFIDIIIEQNNKTKSLNILEDRLENHFYSLENLAINFDKFCLTPIATGAYLLRNILGYTLGFEWVFDLKRRPGPPPLLQEENGVPNAFPVPSIRILPSWKRASDRNFFEAVSYGNFFKAFPFYYPKHAVSLWMPIHYILIHLGHLIGAIVGLPLAILAFPIALIKAGVDTVRAKKEERLEKDRLQNELTLENKEILDVAVKLITEDNMDQVWDLYQNLKGRLSEDYFQDIKDEFIERLKQINPTNDTVQSVLKKIESDDLGQEVLASTDNIDHQNEGFVGTYTASPATMNKTPETPKPDTKVKSPSLDQ